MPSYDPFDGFTGTPDPTLWARGQAAIADARAAAGGASLDVFPGADFIFIDPLNGDPILAESLQDVATVTRASKSWSSGWSGVNGTLAGSLIEHASGKPTWSPYGLQVSPVVENRLANPRGEGAALPGWPSGWGGAATGATVTPSGRGLADGWPYVDITVNGTVSATGFVTFGTGQATASPITAQLGVALVSGSMPATPLAMNLFEAGSSSGADVNIAPNASHRRCSVTATLPGAAANYVLVFFPVGVYDNAVFRLFAPAITETNWPAPVVLPPVGTPGAATRAAETVRIDPALGWYRHDEGTLVVEYDRSLLESQRGIVSLAAGDYWGRIIRNGAGNSTVISETFTQAGGVYSSGVSGMAPGRHITGVRWAGAAHRAATDGVLTAAWTHGADVVYPSFLAIADGGSSQGLTSPSATPIHRVRFFPRALTDDELEAITTPWWEE